MIMKSLLVFMVFLTAISSIALADNMTFQDKVIISPDISFLWNFQRGAEEVFRFVKFSTEMRIDYSLELMERRIGEMEALLNRSTDFIPTVENQYEIEIDKVKTELQPTDILSFLRSSGMSKNVQQRLQLDIKVLEAASKLAQNNSKSYFTSAIAKTYDCLKSVG